MSLATAAILLVILHAAPGEPVEDQLARLRNLGKAFYENTTTQNEAVETFRQALKLKPDSIRERLNFGLALLRAGKTPEGIAELEKVSILNALAHVNGDKMVAARLLGIGKTTLYRKLKEYAQC